MFQDETYDITVILFSDLLDATVVVLDTFRTDRECEIKYDYNFKPATLLESLFFFIADQQRRSY